MKTTIDLPDPIFRRAKATAAVQGISLKSYISKAVEQSLNAGQKDWRAMLNNLPRVDNETLETIRLRVEESDRDNLMLQDQADLQQP